MIFTAEQIGGRKKVARLEMFNPLYHCVALVRDVSLGTYSGADIGHAVWILGFAVVLWRLAVWRLQARLID